MDVCEANDQRLEIGDQRLNADGLFLTTDHLPLTTQCIMPAIMMHRWARLAGALTFSLGACTSAPTASPTASPTAPPVLPSTLAPASATPPPTVISLWLPPFLAPDRLSESGALLQARLSDFEASHPRVRLIVRIKELEGPSGLLETLLLASDAAPAALPDLIILRAGDLAGAVDEERIVPYPAPLPAPDAATWYEFAVESAQVDATRYGVPSSSQTDVLVYDRQALGRPPASWSDVLGSPAPFLFPAADPQAAFTLAQYLALDGQLSEPEGSPAIDPAALEEVLKFYGSAYNAGTLPLTSRQYQSSSQTWTTFEERRATSAVAPLEAWMATSLEDAAASALPTRHGSGIALTTTWSWAVVTLDAERQAIAVELIEWLSEPSFLGPWTHSLGTLPPNGVALDAWPEGPATDLANQLVSIARPMPFGEVIDAVGPAMWRAVDAVLSGGLAPQAAALQAATDVAEP